MKLRFEFHDFKFKKKHIIIAGLIYGLVAYLFYFRELIFSNGLLHWWDLEWWYSKEIYPRFLWNEGVQLFNVPNHILFRSLFFAFPPELAERLLFLTVLSAMGILPMYGIYYLLKENTQTTDLNCFISASVAIVFFLFNLSVVKNIEIYLFLWFLAFTPLLFYLTYNLYRKIQHMDIKSIINKSIIIAFVLSLMSLSERIPYFSTVFLAGVIASISLPYIGFVKKSLVSFLVIISFYIIFSLGWLLPLIGMSINTPKHYLFFDQLDLLSRHANIFDVLTLNAFWHPHFQFSPDNLPNSIQFLWWFSVVLIPVLALSALFYKKNRIIIVLIAYTLFIAFLSKGINPPLSEFYRRLLFDVLPSTIAWQFRAPFYWNILLVFSLSILVSFTVDHILNRIKLTDSSKNTLAKGAVVSIILFAILFPTITSFNEIPKKNGYKTGIDSINYKIEKIPADYKAMYNAMEFDNQQYKILFYPRSPSWGSPKPTIRPSGPGFESDSEQQQYFFWVRTLLLENRLNNIEKILEPWNIKYIIVRKDMPKDVTADLRLEEYNDRLMEKDNLYLINESRNFYVYKVNESGRQVFIPYENILLAAPLSSLSSIADVNEFDLENYSISILDQNLEKQPNSDLVIISNNPFDFYPSIMDNITLIAPFKATFYGSPEKNWARSRMLNAMNAGPWGNIFNGLSPGYKGFEDIRSYQSDYGEGLVFTWRNNSILTVPFNIRKDDTYKIFIRSFKNQKGGALKININGTHIDIPTKDQLDKFEWKELGNYYLKADDYELFLENVYGFNAINLFALIPEEEYRKAEEEITKTLQDKRIIYLFEAESDLYRTNVKYKEDKVASNGELLEFAENGEAWQNIEIIKNGAYRIALRGSGEFEIGIYTKDYRVASKSLNYTYTPSFYLGEGTYRLWIKSIARNSMLDTVWLYSTEKNQTIEELFDIKEKPAEVISFKKINPTLWKIKVNAREPFMLSFGEAYDQFWEARVYKDGKKGEVVKSIPLYSIINGFWINETGDVDIVIRYKPQDWFELGLAISGIAFLASIGYLFNERKKRY